MRFIPTSNAPVRRLLAAMLAAASAFSTQAAVLSGTVTQSGNGAPLANVTVTALRLTIPLGTLQPTSTQTDALGHYQFPTLGAGQYYVEADALGNSVRVLYPDAPCPPQSCDASVGNPGVTQLQLQDAVPTTGIDFAIRQGGQLQGRVRRADTLAALAGQRVVLLPLGWTQVADANGVYQFTRVPQGSWRLLAEGHDALVSTLHPDVPCEFSACGNDTSIATAVVIAPGAALADVDIDMPIGARIGGRLLPAATTTGQQVRFELLHAPSGATAQRLAVPIAADGSYLLQGLAPGTYQLAAVSTAFRPQAYPNVPCGANCSAAIAAGTPVPTTLGLTTTDIDFQLLSSPRIEGVVTDAGSGQPLPGVEVIAYTWSFLGLGGFGPLPRGSAVSAADGSYRIDGLAPLSVKIVTRNRIGYRDERYNDQLCAPSGCLTNEGSDWPLAYDQVMTAHIGLQPGASILGRVGFPAQVNVPPPVVEVFDLAGNLVTTAQLAPGGLFQTTGIAPGAYRVRAYIYFLDGNGQVYGGMNCAGVPAASCDVGTGQILQLAAGAPVEVNIDIGIVFADSFE